MSMAGTSSESPEAVRADIWLWATRLYKTRNLAAQACRKGKVRMQDRAIKPSRLLRVGDELELERQYLRARFRVKDLLLQRVGAKLVESFREELTSDEEREKARFLAEQNSARPSRGQGKGRPTKRDRRQLDEASEAEAQPPSPDDEGIKELWKKAIR